jgi:hypothetical protein
VARVGALAALVPALAGQPAEAFAAADCLPLPALERRPQRLWNRMAAPGSASSAPSSSAG